MSDVMPYSSSRFSALSDSELETYCDAWCEHLRRVLEGFQPDVIHAHHVWMLSSLVKEVVPDVPLVVQSHATGLRQMTLCPHLADGVKRGCARSDRLLALTHGQAREIARVLDVPSERVTVVGAGYREDLFHSRGRDTTGANEILYVGKYSRAKGLPWLLDALERLAQRRPDVRLHVAGSGAGEEADTLRARMEALGDLVVLHGHLDQPALAELMRRCGLFVLPSLYEGLPLVVVEAVACGCRALSTDLPALQEDLAPRLAGWLDLVPAPSRIGPDVPVTEDLPRFVEALEAGLERALDRPPPPDASARLRAFTWRAVYERVEAVWRNVARAR